MGNNKLARVIALLLSVALVFSLAMSVYAASDPMLTTSTETGDSATEEALEILGDAKWAEYREKYGKEPNYTGAPIVVKAADVYSADTTAVRKEAERAGRTNVLYLPDSGTASFKVTVPETGLYAIELSFCPVQSKVSDIEKTLRINGEVPFTEVRNLLMTKRWVDVVSEADKTYDENGNLVSVQYEKDGAGNDRRPPKAEEYIWTDYTVCDPTGYYNDEFFFYLEAGENVISLTAQKEPMALDTITLRARKSRISYAEYKARNEAAGYKTAPAGSKIYLEAEYFSATSSSTIYGQNDKTSAITLSLIHI